RDPVRERLRQAWIAFYLCKQMEVASTHIGYRQRQGWRKLLLYRQIPLQQMWIAHVVLIGTNGRARQTGNNKRQQPAWCRRVGRTDRPRRKGDLSRSRRTSLGKGIKRKTRAGNVEVLTESRAN